MTVSRIELFKCAVSPRSLKEENSSDLEQWYVDIDNVWRDDTMPVEAVVEGCPRDRDGYDGVVDWWIHLWYTLIVVGCCWK